MSAPEGTRPWRKAWRRRWREGSTFRALSPLAKLACIFSEENADDEGRITSTVRQMADALGGWHHEQRIPRMTMWRAWRELELAGVWSISAGRKAERETGRTPSVITRLNFKAYQEKEDDGGTQAGTRSFGEAGHSGRRRQKKQSKEDLSADADQQPVLAVVEPSSPPRLRALTDSLVAAYAEVRGCPYAHGGARDAQALKRLLPLAVDAEILRRWRAGLASSGWASCSTFAQLGSKWNDLAAARPSGFVPAESHESFAARGGGTQEW